MQTYARIIDGVAVEIISLPDGVAVGDRYHPDVAATIAPCPANVDQGWVVSDGEWSPPPAPPAPTQEQMIAYAADRRWRVETGGITVGGVPVATDRESQGLITGAHAYVLANPDVTIKFKAANGFVDLDAATVTAVATAVASHVQACFAAEAEVVAAIADGTVATIQQVDDWPWPA